MNLDATVRVTPASARKDRIYIFDSTKEIQTIDLSAFGKEEISFGRGADNDIVLASKLASRKHGRFVRENGEWIVLDNGSTNGILHNGSEEKRIVIEENDFIRIDDGIETVTDGVLAVFLSDKYSYKWNCVDMTSPFALKKLDSAVDAVIESADNQFYLVTDKSSNILINQKEAEPRNCLHEKDVIWTPNLVIVFTTTCIYYNAIKQSDMTLVDSDMTLSVNRYAQSRKESSPQPAPVQESKAEEEPHCQSSSQSEYKEPSSSYSSGGGFVSFLRTEVGYYVMSLLIAIILWGVTIALWISQGEMAVIVMLICAVFGWKALNSIQPAMFIWMSWTGWIVYFCVKFVLSAIIGLFVAPFKIGKWISAVICDSV